jgi:hypothetical protein
MVIASIWTLASNDALEPSAKEKYKARVVLEQDHLRTMLQSAHSERQGSVIVPYSLGDLLLTLFLPLGHRHAPGGTVPFLLSTKGIPCPST